MANMPAGSRRYDLAVRRAKARRTRMRIIEAARELFLAGGYVGTTLDAVASRAGVSPQTVYNLVGGKSTLLKTVYDVSLVGDDEPVPVAARPEYQRLFEAPTARGMLVIYAEVNLVLWARVGALIRLATAQAAAGDRELAEFVCTIETERATGTRELVAHMAGRFGLRPGLTVADAADIFWTVTGPDIVERLVAQRGWPWDRYREWLVDTVHHCLFGAPA